MKTPTSLGADHTCDQCGKKNASWLPPLGWFELNRTNEHGYIRTVDLCSLDCLHIWLSDNEEYLRKGEMMQTGHDWVLDYIADDITPTPPSGKPFMLCEEVIKIHVWEMRATPEGLKWRIEAEAPGHGKASGNGLVPWEEL